MTPIEKLNTDFQDKFKLIAEYIYEYNFNAARALYCDYFLNLIELYNPEHHDENAVYFIFHYTDFPSTYMNSLYPDYFYREAISRGRFIYKSHEMKGTLKYKFYSWIKDKYQKLPVFFKEYIFRNKEKFNIHLINPLNYLFDNNAGLSIELESYFNPTYKSLPKETLIKILNEYKTQGTSLTFTESTDGYYDTIM